MKFFEHFSNSQMQRIWHVQSWLKNKEIDLSKCDINHRRDVESFQRIELAIHGTDEKAFASMVETWANGATDHLYDLRIPKQWQKTELAKNVTELRNFGLRMGHGFTRENHTYDAIEKLRNLCQKIAVEADILIGIKKGDWGRC